MVMLNRKVAGVTLDELRAAVVLARAAADPCGVEWSFEQWARVWGLLSATQQRVVYLVVLIGRSHNQVAGELGISRAAVAGTWRRALARIRDSVPSDN